jgi:hypothetical protein
VVLDFTLLDGRPGVNTFHVDNGTGDPWTSSDLSDICAAFHTWYGAGDGSGNTYRSRVSNDVTLDTVSARDLTSESGAFSSALVAQAGQDTHDNLDNGVSFALKRLSGLTGRSNRGRIYLVGLTVNSVDGGSGNHVSTAAVTDWIAAFDSLKAAVSAYGGVATATYSILSRSHNQATRPAGVGIPVDHHAIADTAMDFMRRRSPGNH